ncbi:cytochrome oxidase biogenesis protein surf1 [Vibrio ishigakensis]|uniref:SURF1-like protein n=1 Tax=Vibrio ishigakensis TaxID=1481914 RepID=A0A0B8PDC9_9VIBR|nr:cytochrome oxidase biogenesis protein surf1 [Vibrio ishigakensis]
MMINLKMNGDMSAPALMVRVTVTLLTVGVFVLLVKLGFWQLSRGEEKLGFEEDLSARDSMVPLSLNQIESKVGKEVLTGYPLKAKVETTSSPLIYWDNVTHESQVGYRVFEVMKVVVDGEPRGLLVELGFIKGESSRESLPKVETVLDTQEVTGRVFEKSHNPLSSDLLPEMLDGGLRIQNLNMPQLGAYLDLPILPFALQPETSESSLPLIWKPYPMTSEKHFGYAFQWFSMAGVYALLVVLIVVRRKLHAS